MNAFVGGVETRSSRRRRSIAVVVVAGNSTTIRSEKKPMPMMVGETLSSSAFIVAMTSSPTPRLIATVLHRAGVEPIRRGRLKGVRHEW